MEKEKAPLPTVDFPGFTIPSYSEWKEEAITSLKGAPFEKKLLTKTYEGITLQPLYTAENAAAFTEKSNIPGGESYLRGTSAAGYSAKTWLIAQKGDTADPQKAHDMLREGLSKGVSAICFNPNCCPKLSNLQDIHLLLDGIDVLNFPFQVFCGAESTSTLALLAAYAKEQGVDSAAFYGVIGADPLGTLALQGTNCNSMASYYDQMANNLRFTALNMPLIKTIFIQSSVYHEGGANAIQELAAMFATAVSYLDALTERGLSVDSIAGSMVFSFSLGANFFMEIAKLRAARLLWSKIIAAYGGNEDSAKLDARAATSRFTTTVYDPYVNILRSATQAFSGIVGGVDALTVEPFDTALRHSDEQSRRIARNIQMMLENEFNLTTPIDPAGGSWFVETLTGQVIEATWEKLQQIEEDGGILQVLHNGTLQAEINATLQERFKKLSTRADHAVGSNMYANVEERGERREDRKTADACRGDHWSSTNCVCDHRSSANVGESETVTPISPHRWTEQFEALRIKTEAHTAKTGKNIEVFLANMGPLSQHKARADFSAGFMEVGGFTVLRNDGFADVAAAAWAAVASQAQATIICSTDDTYPEIVPELSRAIKAEAPQMLVILAGAPAPEFKNSYLEAGVDDFIHVKADCLSVLRKIQLAGGNDNE
ncbi:MAG: acyl-CoA mutase large subunit family protein [Firmicutes bacterium]|nr:acyl-CoA mutase large subunit family protein [Bacillota bacterium]